MGVHSHDGYVMVAVCFLVTFLLVHVAIETHTHLILLVLNQVYGAGSPATLKGKELYGDCMGIVTSEYQGRQRYLQFCMSLI